MRRANRLLLPWAVFAAAWSSTPTIARADDEPGHEDRLVLHSPKENATSANEGLALDSSATSRKAESPGEPHDSFVPVSGMAASTARAAESLRIPRRVSSSSEGEHEIPWYRGGFASLGAVLGIIGLAAVLAKRLFGPRGSVRGDCLQVMSRLHLSPKQSISLVQMGSRLVFVGITPDRINTLRVVDDVEEASWIKGRLNAVAPNADDSAFHAMLSREAEEFAKDTGVESKDVTQSVRVDQARAELSGVLSRIRRFSENAKHSPRRVLGKKTSR